MGDYVVSTCGRIQVRRLPAYAQQLNPVDSMRGDRKPHEIADHAWELSVEATAALRKMRRHPSIITAC